MTAECPVSWKAKTDSRFIILRSGTVTCVTSTSAQSPVESWGVGFTPAQRLKSNFIEYFLKSILSFLIKALPLHPVLALLNRRSKQEQSQTCLSYALQGGRRQKGQHKKLLQVVPVVVKKAN